MRSNNPTGLKMCYNKIDNLIIRKTQCLYNIIIIDKYDRE